jgi:hypothetical protein
LMTGKYNRLRCAGTNKILDRWGFISGFLPDYVFRAFCRAVLTVLVS